MNAADPSEGAHAPAPVVVTVSASYGAGGSHVGPAVAERLGLRFLDRAIPATVAERMAVPLEEVLAHDERVERGLGRLFAAFAQVPELGGAPISSRIHDEAEFKAATERVIGELAEHGGVILGRAAAIVIGERPNALHVRLDGPPEARLRQSMSGPDASEEDARERMQEADKGREAYVRHFHGCRPDDAGLYHLVIDSTAIQADTCVELIVTAARARVAATS